MLQRRPSLFNCADEILDGLGLPDRLRRKVDAKGPLDAQDQFSAGEAVNSEVALNTARWIDVDESAALGVKLTNEIAHNRDQPIAVQLGIARCKTLHNST